MKVSLKVTQSGREKEKWREERFLMGRIKIKIAADRDYAIKEK